MFCTKCGAKNPEDATFCYKCGNEMYGANDNSSDDKIVNDTVEKNKDVVNEKKENNSDTITKKDNEDEVSVNPLASFWGGILDFYGKLGRRDFWAAVIIMAS